MKLKLSIFISLCAIVIAISSCKKDNDGGTTPPPPPPPPDIDTAGPLKSASSFPIGIAIEYGLFKNNASYRNTVVREADQVTFGYQMKHGAIVKDDGSFDFSLADELYNLANSNGLQVFGHTLVWHSNQNGNYLRSQTVTSGGAGTTNLLPTGDFEAGTGTSGTGSTLFTGWNLLIGGSASGTFASTAGNGSARALQATITTPGANAYDIQAIGSSWTATVGTQYLVSFDVKASAAGGKLRIVNQNAQYQQYEITPTTSWSTYTWTLTALETSPILRLNFPVAGIYTVDNIKISEVTAGGPLPAAQAAANIDSAMSRFIRTSMMRYSGKVKAWDVVNEPMTDGTGAVRSNSGTTTGDIFYWSQYLGRDYALKAFNYAKAADPSALLFINDYNLESDARKLDSLVAYVNELTSKGAKIDGIGTQMHMSTATPKSGIDNMFVKLAATGLKIRISELDIRVNPNNTTPFVPSAQNLDDQAAMYRYVVESFRKNVPAAQRYDLTIWGVSDSDSWIVTVLHREDYPLLFNSSYEKKPAYTALIKALRAP
jgi:endo-1,4-beta-xylanase